jgi:hypothetical protein
VTHSCARSKRHDGLQSLCAISDIGAAIRCSFDVWHSRHTLALTSIKWMVAQALSMPFDPHQLRSRSHQQRRLLVVVRSHAHDVSSYQNASFWPYFLGISRMALSSGAVAAGHNKISASATKLSGGTRRNNRATSSRSALSECNHLDMGRAKQEYSTTRFRCISCSLMFSRRVKVSPLCLGK